MRSLVLLACLALALASAQAFGPNCSPVNFDGRQTGWLRCELPNAPNALCLNGQPYNYFLRPSPLSNPTNSWNIFLEGSGSSPNGDYDNFCNDPKSCLAKSLAILPFKSDEFTKTLVNLDINGGILAFDPNNNKEFSSFNIAYLPSCDGSGFLGDLKDPIKVQEGNSTIYLRGFVNLMAAMNDLLTVQGLNKVKDVLLSGSSTGGIAVLSHLDTAASLFPNSIVRGLSSDGFLLDYSDLKGNLYYEGLLRAMLTLHNGTSHLNPHCLSGIQSGLPWQCLYAQYAYPYLKTSVFVTESLYDTWQLVRVMASPGDGLGKFWGQCPSNPTTCNDLQTQTLQTFYAAMASVLQTGSFTDNVNSFWAPSCFITELATNNNSWLKLELSGKSLAAAVSDWYFGRSTGTQNQFLDDPYPNGCGGNY